MIKNAHKTTGVPPAGSTLTRTLIKSHLSVLPGRQRSVFQRIMKELVPGRSKRFSETGSKPVRTKAYKWQHRCTAFGHTPSHNPAPGRDVPPSQNICIAGAPQGHWKPFLASPSLPTTQAGPPTEKPQQQWACSLSQPSGASRSGRHGCSASWLVHQQHRASLSPQGSLVPHLPLTTQPIHSGVSSPT